MTSTETSVLRSIETVQNQNTGVRSTTQKVLEKKKKKFSVEEMFQPYVSVTYTISDPTMNRQTKEGVSKWSNLTEGWGSDSLVTVYGTTCRRHYLWSKYLYSVIQRTLHPDRVLVRTSVKTKESSSHVKPRTRCNSKWCLTMVLNRDTLQVSGSDRYFNLKKRSIGRL